ncbi:VOC family protein [Cyclobacterium amurskyense]|uniref:Lactoylglutathione lyase-like lyase n=1 Tax=Cyclobacterium amurskyense TaxID=320787 RepID=A0A0H4PBI9_9BACT|nr:VOC family protein [Cyclobacterium amurskyense]AKP51816.1 Lactoylglutathione lyase-like lyase [Cyclobacterium amurskyense]|tara:strand:+ start:5194 stop:5592 length:399 start_codon:yes stop_codon:yes gene_type:complete
MKEPIQIKINHYAVYARNLIETNKFYSDIIGLQKIEDPFKDDKHTWFDIGCGLSVHVIERDQPWKEQLVDRTNHVCFCVTDLEAFMEKLNKHQVPFGDSKGSNGKVNLRPDGIRQIFFQDPNGYWIEINDDI